MSPEGLGLSAAQIRCAYLQTKALAPDLAARITALAAGIDADLEAAIAKLLAAIRKLMLETIPVDSARPEFRQGGTLGPSRKHWFRAKFGGGRFRLSFRYSSSAKIIIYAWVNDRETLRTFGSKPAPTRPLQWLVWQGAAAPLAPWLQRLARTFFPWAARILAISGPTPPCL